MKLAGCNHLKLHGENRVWFRAFDPSHMSSPLATGHTLTGSSRFSSGSLLQPAFEILYLSENPHVCLREVGALYGSSENPIANPSSAWVTINVSVVLKNVADLTVVMEQRRLGTTAQELTGDWEGYKARNVDCSVPGSRGTAPTQDLGQALFTAPGIEGFRTVSAKVPHQMNLIVFPTKLMKGSSIAYTDRASGQVHQIKG